MQTAAIIISEPNETELEVNLHFGISDLSWSHLTLELTSLM